MRRRTGRHTSAEKQTNHGFSGSWACTPWSHATVVSASGLAQPDPTSCSSRGESNYWAGDCRVRDPRIIGAGRLYSYRSMVVFRGLPVRSPRRVVLLERCRARVLGLFTRQARLPGSWLGVGGRAAKPDIAGGGVWRIRRPSIDPIAIAVRGVTQIRATPHDLELALPRPARADPRTHAVIVRRKPVLAPLPDVSRRLEQLVAIWGIRADGRGAQITVVARVDAREDALPNIHPMFPRRAEIIAPREPRLGEPASRSVFPLSLRRQSQIRPCAECSGIVPRNVHRRVNLATSTIAMRAFGVAPVCPVDLPPPRGLDHPLRGRERIRKQAGEHKRPPVVLCVGEVARIGDEQRELRVRYRRGRHPIRRYFDRMDHHFAIARNPVPPPIAHGERAAWDIDQLERAMALGFRCASGWRRRTVTARSAGRTAVAHRAVRLSWSKVSH